MSNEIYDKSLEYHRLPTAGKISVEPSKPLTTQTDLAMAYTPGVAAVCEAIVKEPGSASDYTARGNLVAVVTNGTAVLGLGAIGPLASKPVMEGKAVLFKKFAGVDVFDIELDENDPDRLVDIIAALEPTFAGINLEDIKAPECFIVEQKLKQRLNIPVFHDDQHGTAIITSAALINALHIIEKEISKIRLVTSGAGAAGVACLDLLVSLGLDPANIVVTDRKGVVYEGRPGLDPDSAKARFAVDSKCRTLADAMVGADVFLGVSGPGLVSAEMVASMAVDPVILALANPIPEIMPAAVRAVREDAIIATGRSDFPNQVNNVLCFPYIFRGALDVGATSINDPMKMAVVHALAELARIESSDISAAAYGGDLPYFGREYLIPQPFDPRLVLYIAPAVAKAAMDSGVATRPIEDMDEYRARLTQFVFRSGLLMKPMFDQAKADPKRVVYAEGEEEVVLRAVQNVIDDGLALPILVARPEVLTMRIEKLGLRICPGRDVEVVNPENDPRFREYWELYHHKLRRRGVTPDIAKTMVRTRNSVIAALMVERGEADATISGVVGRFQHSVQHVVDVLGLKEGVRRASSLSAIVTQKRQVFICDTRVNPNPNAENIAEATLMAAQRVREFGLKPKVALVCHSNFGTHDDPHALRMREALCLIRERAPELEVEGEMTVDSAMMEVVRERLFPESKLSGSANLLIMPDQASAHIAFSMTRIMSEAVSIGPILMGVRKPAHVLPPSATVRRVVNMTAIAVCDAQRYWRNRQVNLEGV
jgi:malate dehydrogenase (oxaloacetate-decarboxylating)(NADP+)